MTHTQLNDLNTLGYTIIQNVVDPKRIHELSRSIDIAFLHHKQIQIQNNSDIKTEGVALHALLSSDAFIDFLYTLIENGFIRSLQQNFFKSNCILNSFSALNNIPNQPNFSSLVHRDLRFYSGNFPIMINCLVMIDEFTVENGGTYLLQGSHLSEDAPTDSEFFDKAVQATGNSGDILIFNSNVWHAAAPNTTNKDRRAIPITISRSFMKQLLDYPRALGYDKMATYSTEMQQFLGYHSRVPASLTEWYVPSADKFYKKNQD